MRAKTSATQVKKNKSTSKLNILQFDASQPSEPNGVKRLNPLTAFSTSSLTQTQEVPFSQSQSKGKGKAKARPKADGLQSTRLSSTNDHDNQLWVHMYEPTTEAELAVHTRKVEDVRRWLTEALDGGPSGKLRRYRKILALTGPAGTAKTTTVRILSREMGFEILEWHNSLDDRFPSESNFDIEGYEATSAKFVTFLNRATNCQNIFGPKAAKTNAPTSRHVILLEDLPNILHPETQIMFHEALDSLVASESSSPVIIIISDAGLRGEIGEDTSFSINRKDTVVDIRTALPKSMLHGPHVTHIKFNPIAATLMRKSLQALLNTHFSESASSDLPPSRDFIDAVIDSANGDIRSAIMALQFACVLDVSDAGRPKGRSKAKSRKSKVVLQAITRREQSLVLFHLLGKILYNKRKGDPPNASATAKDVQKERDSDAQIEDPPPLPPYLREHERQPSRVDVNALYADSPIDSSLLSLYIHQNYPQFCDDIEQCSGISDWLSWVDSSGGESWYQANPHQFHLVTLGTLHSLPSPVERRSQKLLKPEFFDALTREKTAWDAVRDVQGWIALQEAGSPCNGFSAWTKSTIPLELSSILKASNAVAENLPANATPPPSHVCFSQLQFQTRSAVGQLLEEDGLGTQPDSGLWDEDDCAARGPSKNIEETDSGWLESDDIEDF